MHLFYKPVSISQSSFWRVYLRSEFMIFCCDPTSATLSINSTTYSYTSILCSCIPRIQGLPNIGSLIFFLFLSSHSSLPPMLFSSEQHCQISHFYEKADCHIGLAGPSKRSSINSLFFFSTTWILMSSYQYKIRKMWFLLKLIYIILWA